MSEVRRWLDMNDQRLVDIAERSDTSVEFVHLAAVLVLAGLTDEQIHDQVAVLELQTLKDHPRDGLSRALEEIRAITPHGGPDDDGAGASDRPAARTTGHVATTRRRSR